jgi:hypothetical protein
VVPPLPVTVIPASLLVMRPPNPCMLAVIVVVPAPTPVTTPSGLTVATAAMLDDHVTVEVMFWLVEGWFPCPYVPMAVSCAVLPVPSDTVEGDMVIESTVVLLPQPINGATRQTKSNALKQKRPDIELSSHQNRPGDADT